MKNKINDLQDKINFCANNLIDFRRDKHLYDFWVKAFKNYTEQKRTVEKTEINAKRQKIIDEFTRRKKNNERTKN